MLVADMQFGVLVLAGLAQHQVNNAGRLLAQLSITTPTPVAKLLASPAHVAACNKFARDLNTGKRIKAHSLSGLLLTILDLKKPNSGRRYSTAPLKRARHSPGIIPPRTRPC